MSKRFGLFHYKTIENSMSILSIREMFSSWNETSWFVYLRFLLFVKILILESVGPKTEDLYKKLPCLVCGAAASGIHFGAVTCEACKVRHIDESSMINNHEFVMKKKGFFRRSIKENAPERYRCAENNNCQILATSKITCRACRFAKCIQAGMSMDGSIL